MRLASIASGSSGNCIYIGSDNHHLLIDDGIPGKRVTEALHALDVKPEELEGVLVTHEHRDHVGGLGVLSRKYHLPIYGTEATLAEIQHDEKLGKIPEELFHPIEKEADFQLGDLTVHPFAISHDAVDPVAYRVVCGEKRTAVVTDLGEYDERIIGELQELDTVLIEANHDVRMLQVGPYPYPLKQRILSDRGHMCNEAAGQLLTHILHDRMRAVFLGHLSKENNYPELALETVKMEISLGDCPYRASDFPIQVAPRTQMSSCVAW
ncbi:MAG: MBL fold metallo-hydrolase [Lachnospiraceae bacterium]|nr:MBL fold metallo-hydrolase [Lachnospiraceae bacterium]